MNTGGRRLSFSFWLVLAIGVAFFWSTPLANPQSQRIHECHWTPGLAQILGITPDIQPQDVGGLPIVSAVVVDPVPLVAIGLFGTAAGNWIKMICLGENTWRIKNYASGLSVSVTIEAPSAQ